MTIRVTLERAVSTALEVRVVDSRGSRVLWYRSDEPVWQAPPATLDFAGVALAHYAARTGEDLHLAGTATAAQLDRLDEFLQIWADWRPDLFRHVEITADEEIGPPEQHPLRAPANRRGAVMGFSGGVDAAFALAAHATGAVGRLSRRVDLGVLAVGWDLRHGDEEGRKRAADSARAGLDAYGAETAVVATNWKQDFCPAWFMSFNSGLTAMLHTFSASHSTAVHATDLSYRLELDLPPYGSHMVTNHLLGNPAFPLISTGGTHRRIDRVRFLRDHPALLENLRVCYQEGAAGSNCGRCEKCVRTQLELRACGLPAEGAFPTPMRQDDLTAARATNPTVVGHFVDVANALPEEDEMRRQVLDWVARERLAEARRAKRPLARVADLERRVRTLEADLSALHDSRSWRITRPLRAGSDLARRLRSRLPSPRHLPEGPR